MADPDASSRILTLVFTDLVESTALKMERGDRAGGELIERHRALVGRLAAEWSGRVVDWAGDGCFLTFETPSAAVSFALCLEQAHGEEPDLPGVRTGIHLGEVSERPEPDGDATHPRVEGLAVDLAARIASLAGPAQILMSATVADSARQRIDPAQFPRPIRWRGYGRYALKGFDEPLEIREAGLEGVAVFEAPAASEKARPVEPTRPAPARSRTSLVAVGVTVALAVAVAALLWSRGQGGPETSEAPDDRALTVPDFGDRPAIAVLPFDNLSPDPEQAFFADGLAEDLITRLAAWRAFPVIARNSSFQYRGGNLDLKRVSRELGVHYVVEGSVRRAGDRIRVTAQLIDAPSGEHVWAETFDRDVTDLFALQDEISATVAASLVSDLRRAEAERARQRGTDQLEAWSAYQLGIQHGSALTSEGWAAAREYFQRAVELDPRFASALAGLAMTHMWEIALSPSEVPEETVSEAREMARRAAEIDPRDPTAQTALGWSYLMVGDVKNGFDTMRRAVELNPSMPEAWGWFSYAQLMAGDPEGAVASGLRAQQLDPRGVLSALVNDSLTAAYWELGRYREGLEASRKLAAARPGYFFAHLWTALNLVGLGRVDEARGAIDEARRIEPGLSHEVFQRALGVPRPEVDARRNAALLEAGLE